MAFDPNKKACTKCKKIKPLCDYYKNKQSKDGLQFSCKLCSDLWRKQDRKDNPKKYQKAYLKANLRNGYGLTINDLQKMIDSQNGLCLGCGKPAENTNRNNKRLHIDHDHKTGKIRGLLCIKCNRALGLVNENVDILLNLIKYLRR